MKKQFKNPADIRAAMALFNGNIDLKRKLEATAAKQTAPSNKNPTTSGLDLKEELSLDI